MQPAEVEIVQRRADDGKLPRLKVFREAITAPRFNLFRGQKIDNSANAKSLDDVDILVAQLV